MKTDEDIARMKSCMNMPLHSSRIAPPRTTSLRRHTSNLSPKSTGSHSPKHTPLHSPRRSTERQPSLRRAPSNTFHLNTESSLRRTQENNGSITPTHSTKPKKHGKKGKKGGKRKNSSGEGATTADEWEDEDDNISVVGTGGEKHSSFGLAGSFKSLVGSVKSAVFGTSLPLKGSSSGITTTVSTTRKEEYSQNILEEELGDAGDKPQEEHTHKSKMGETAITTAPSTTTVTTTVPIITTTNSAEQCSENKEGELAAVRERVKPTRRTFQLGSFLSALTTGGGIAATALGSLMKGWGTSTAGAVGTTTTNATTMMNNSGSNKIVPME